MAYVLRVIVIISAATLVFLAVGRSARDSHAGGVWFEANALGLISAENPSATPTPNPSPTPPTNPIPIHDIQGSVATSPYAGQVVTTAASIVTGLQNNGFFVQTPDANVDANPNTSEGIFVFTSSAPPASAVIGNAVQVTGIVNEFIPPSDPNSPSETELISPTVTIISTGNPLPAPVTITAIDTLVNDLNNLEKYEGMRVRVDSLTVVAPTQGTIDEVNATSTSNGVFYGVITGVARPFREPGVQVPDPIPTPTPNPNHIPRFDANSERIRVDSGGQSGATALEVAAGATVTNITGPLDYAFRAYTILPDPGAPPAVSGNISAVPVPMPFDTDLTIASFNMQRFFDKLDDPNIGDPVLTTTAFNNRLNKASLAIRNVMRSPDVIGVEEMENLSSLQAVAAKTNNDTLAAGGENPNYQAYLIEGNDVGGIDVGFLVKASRVSVVDVTQVGKDTTYINPNDGMPQLLNDRPPLVLRATIQDRFGLSLAFTVIVVHQRSLSGITDAADGNRIRTKRRAQAEFLANYTQSRQAGDPNENLVVVGDYNAFQFNDGFVDVIGTVKGTPAPPDLVLLASSDLVNPDLVDLTNTLPADQRYSFMFDGNAQALDHVLVNNNMFSRLNRFAYARNNADFPESFRNDPNRPERISDHDPEVSYFKLPTPPVPAGDTVLFSSPAYSVNEGCASVTITVNRADDFSPGLTVDFATSDGSAQQRTDYTPASGTLTFGDGVHSQTFSVLINKDAYREGVETINLTLSNPKGHVVLGNPDKAVLTINDDATVPTNIQPIDDAATFVCQHYHDFLNRESDPGGLAYWSSQITQCGSDQTCIRTKRIDVSNAFYFELEFQQTGSYVYRLYRAAFGNNQPFPNPNPDPANPGEEKKVPLYLPFMKDRAQVRGGSQLAQLQLALANAFVQRPEFLTKYPASLDGPGFVDAVLATIMNDIGVDLRTQRQGLIDLFNAGGRGNVTYHLADDNIQTNPINNRAFIDAEYNRAFAFTQYAGYLRRNPDMAGFLFWLGQVNRGPLRNGDTQHAMVCSFITSAEYQQRFSPIVTHTNAECPNSLSAPVAVVAFSRNAIRSGSFRGREGELPPLCSLNENVFGPERKLHNRAFFTLV